MAHTRLFPAASGLLASLFLAIGPGDALARPGDPDATFGTGGRVSLGSSGLVAQSMVQQPDGKLVIGGSTTSPRAIVIARLNVDGTFDSGFGTAGLVSFTFPGFLAFGTAVVLQPDGKIVATGYATSGSISRCRAVRVNATGSVDTGFGTGGEVDFNFGPGSYCYAMALQQDGKLVIAGTFGASPSQGAFGRLNADGSVDTSFNGGKVVLAIPGDTSLKSVLVQGDGRIVVAGQNSQTVNMNTVTSIAIARVESNGAIDMGFGTSGYTLTTAVPGFYQSLARQSDGRYIVATTTFDGATTTNHIAALRYTTGGGLDDTFGTAGLVRTPIGATSSANAVAVQPDDAILVAGSANVSAQNRTALVRYLPNGALDARFGVGGIVVDPHLGSGAVMNAVTLQADRRAVVAGSSGSQMAVARFLTAPSPRADANNDGRSDVTWREIAGGLDYQWQMNGLAISNQGYLPSVPPSWSIAAVGDTDGDGRADVFWREPSTGLTYQWLMNGLAIASQGYMPTVPAPWTVIGLGDFDGDGRADVLWRNTATGQNYIWLLNGLAIASQGYTVTVGGTDWEPVAIADFTGDGRADVFWRNKVTGENYLWVMNAITVANAGFLNTVSTDWEIVGAPDANGDGIADILWRNKVTGQMYLWIMSGFTTTAQGYLPTVADLDWKVVGFGDYNGDGRGDVLWRHATNGQNYMWTLNGLAVEIQGYLPSVADPNWRPVK